MLAMLKENKMEIFMENCNKKLLFCMFLGVLSSNLAHTQPVSKFAKALEKFGGAVVARVVASCTKHVVKVSRKFDRYVPVQNRLEVDTDEMAKDFAVLAVEAGNQALKKAAHVVDMAFMREDSKHDRFEQNDKDKLPLASFMAQKITDLVEDRADRIISNVVYERGWVSMISSYAHMAAITVLSLNNRSSFDPHKLARALKKLQPNSSN